MAFKKLSQPLRKENLFDYRLEHDERFLERIEAARKSLKAKRGIKLEDLKEVTMPRSKTSQSKHDAQVRQIAKKLRDGGYKVQADVRGFPQPDTIGGYRPDVVAKKGKQKKIVEVETQDSVNSARDKEQQKAFRQAANRSENTTFTRKVTS